MISDSTRSEEHTSELQSQFHLVCRLLLEKKKGQHIAGGEIEKFHIGREYAHRDREQRRDHHSVEHRLDALVAVEMPGQDAHLAARVRARCKKRKTADVVEVGVAIEEIELGGLAGGHQLVPQQAQPCAAVEDHQVVAFFFNDAATTEIYTLSLHDALPI